MFESQKSQQPKEVTPESVKEEKAHDKKPLDVHTMPMKFHVHGNALNTPNKPGETGFTQPTEKKKSDVGKYVLIGVGAVVVVGLLVVGFLFYQRSTNKQLSNANANTNVNSNLNSLPTLNFNTNASNANSNSNSNTNSNANSNSNSNANANSNVNAAQLPLSQIASSLDSDSDGLTDVEEALFGTDPKKADTDKDGFSDGQEVKFGYSPLDKGKLEGSTLTGLYQNTTFGFSFLYPSKWTVQQRGTDQRGVLLVSQSGDEYIDVSVQDNVSRLTPVEWYRLQAPNVNASNIVTVMNWKKDVTGVSSIDGYSTFYGAGNYIFTLYYNTNNKTKVDYKAASFMIAGSFELLPVTSIINSNTNTNTNANTNANTNSNSNANLNSNTNTNTNSNTNTGI